MQFDEKLTEQMKAFVHADEKDRDYKEAALVLLKVSGNRVEYRNNLDNLESKKAHILKRLSQYLEFRLKALTKEQVREMEEKAVKIIANIPKEEERINFGMRQDHDSLPEEMLAIYKEVNIILQKQKQLHLKIRSLALSNAPCPDSELYPFVKEIIELDKERLAKWKKYDSFNNKPKWFI